MKTVYLDATIPSYLFDERPELAFQRRITREWWEQQRPRYRVFLSRETLAELERGDYPYRDAVLREAAAIPVLAPVDAVRQAAATYVRDRLMPADLRGDAAHLAYASVYAIDFLLTWNCSHLANANKAEHISVVNRRLGLHTPMIITPLELFEES